MGPILYFRGARECRWNLSVLMMKAAGDNPSPLLTDTTNTEPFPLALRRRKVLWRYDFSLPFVGGDWSYRIGGATWRVCVPSPGGDLRLAFTACNGSEEGNTWTSAQVRNACWLDLASEHARHPFHLLLQGGDQLYADTVWREVPALGEWRWGWRKHQRMRFSGEVAEAVAEYYFRRYCWLWAQPQLAPIFAQIPSLMMWDDHDIFDGWGSYAPSRQQCEVFQGIYSAAREHFALFQLAARRDDLPEGFSDRRGGHFGWAYRIKEMGILAPDLRSERTRAAVMSETGWHAFLEALESMAECRHVLLISTVPLVNAHLTCIEGFFDFVPGHQSWQDDLIDQWPSRAHWHEWERLVSTLLDFSNRTGACLTSLSGEIHLGALGLIENNRTKIYQITSSGIVHPPPSALATAGLEWSSTGEIRLAPDITVKLLPMAGASRRYLRARSWLELNVAAGGGLQAVWHGEKGEARDYPSITVGAGCGSARKRSDT